jgi:outer membrane protein TolC
MLLQDQLVQLLERRLAEGEASSLDVTRERINRNQASLALRDA